MELVVMSQLLLIKKKKKKREKTKKRKTRNDDLFQGVKSRFAHLEMFSQIFFKFVVCNPCYSFASSTILVPLWFSIISLVFFYLSKVLFSRRQNNSKCHLVGELISKCFGCS